MTHIRVYGVADIVNAILYCKVYNYACKFNCTLYLLRFKN